MDLQAGLIRGRQRTGMDRPLPASPRGAQPARVEIAITHIGSTGSNVAKQGWSGLSEEQLARRLGRILGVTWEAGEQPGRGGSAGAMAEVGEDAWVALQVERKHNHPAENVLQYWPWLERNRRRVVLVHAIAPDARRRTGPRADLTSWLGAMMERVLPGRFRYCRLELGAGDEADQVGIALSAIAALREPLDSRPLLPGH